MARLGAEAGEGVPEIVDADAFDSSGIHQLVETFARINDMLAWVPSRKYPRATLLPGQFYQKLFRLIAEHDMVRASILGMRDALDSTLQVDVFPACGQGFVASSAC